MPTKYRRRTPIAERVYRSSPGLVQQQLPSLKVRRRQRASTGTPFNGARQSTLTQIDFITPSGRPKRFDSYEEIADSQDEDDVDEARPAKRRRRDGKHVGSLRKQDTLTQMDFIKLLTSAPLDEDFELPQDDAQHADPKPSDRQDDIQHSADGFATKSLKLPDGKHHLEAFTPSIVNSGCPEFIPPEHQSQHLVDKGPKTPEKSQKITRSEVPSSQSPAATPISLPSVRSAKRFYQMNQASPTPKRTTKRIQWANEYQAESGSSPPESTTPLDEDVEKPPHAAPTHATQHVNGIATQTQHSNVASSIHQSRQSSQSPSSHANKQSQKLSSPGRRNTNTETQTQTSPATRKRISEFNSRWAAICKAGPPSTNVKTMGPPAKKLTTDLIKSTVADLSSVHDCYLIGDETQRELMQGEFSGTGTEQDSETQLGLLASNRAFEIPTCEEALSFDDTVSSPLCVNESPVVVKPRRMFTVPSSQEEENVVSESQDEEIPETNQIADRKRHRFSSPIPASQATTVPGTPRSQAAARYAHRTHQDPRSNSVILVASTPESQRRQQSVRFEPQEEEPEQSPELPEYSKTGDSQFKRPAGISQLLPSSIWNSDVPLPPESMDFV